MAKPNYSFEKRQRELAKKKKKEEKAQRKTHGGKDDGPEQQEAGAEAQAPEGEPASPAPGQP